MISTFLMSEVGHSLLSQATPDPGRDELDMSWNQPQIGPDFPELEDLPWARSFGFFQSCQISPCSG